MRRTAFCVVALALGLTLFLVLRADRDPEGVAPPTTTAERGQRPDPAAPVGAAPAERALAGTPSMSVTESQPLGAAGAPPAAAAVPQMLKSWWSFRWRLIDQLGDPISVQRLQDSGASYHQLLLRYGTQDGEEHAERPLGGGQLDFETPIVGVVSIDDGEAPAWIEVQVGERVARMDYVHEDTAVDLVMALPESSELGRARFVGFDEDGQEIHLYRVVAAEESNEELDVVLSTGGKAGDAPSEVSWVLSGAAGTYRCSASADPRLQGVTPVYGQAHAEFELVAGEEVRVELHFPPARTVSGVVSPAPGDGLEFSVRQLANGLAAAAMAPLPAGIGDDGAFEYPGLSPEEIELAVLIADPEAREVRMYVFPVAADEDEVVLQLEDSRVPARYHLLESTHAKVWLRAEDAHGTVLYQGPTPTGLLLRLPAGEHRFYVAPMLDTGNSMGPDLTATVLAEVGPAGPGGVRDLSFELPE